MTRRATLAVVVVVMAALGALALVSRFSRSTPPLPELNLTEMEPQVAEKITRYLEDVIAEPDSSEAWGELAVVLHAHRLDREAVECYEKAVALSPSEFRWQYLLVHALRPVEPDRALDQSAKALALDSEYSPAHLVRGELLEEANDVDGALAHYEKAYALDPASAKAAFSVGRIYLRRGEGEKALELLKKASELDPEAGPIHASLAQAYRRAGDREMAAAEGKLAFEKKSAVGVTDSIHFRMRQESVSSLAQVERALQAFDAGDYARAEELYRSLVELRPDDADMRARFGDTLASQNKLEPAKAQYRLAIQLLPEHPSAHYGLGNIMNLEGDYEEALRHYEESLATRGDHVATLVNYGSLLAFRGDVRGAEEAFRKAIELEPTAFGPQRQLGELLLRQKRTEEAIERLSAAVKIEPNHGAVHLQLAVAHAMAGDFARALKHAEEAERLGEPVPPDLLPNLRKRSGPSGPS